MSDDDGESLLNDFWCFAGQADPRGLQDDQTMHSRINALSKNDGAQYDNDGIRIQGIGIGSVEKQFVHDIYFEYKKKLKAGEALHYKAILCDIVQGVFTALVSILIPLSQTYSNVSVNLLGSIANLGTVLSMAAVGCSWFATIIHVYQAASKNKQNAQRNINEASHTETELQTFLAGAGKYDIDDNQDLFYGALDKIGVYREYDNVDANKWIQYRMFVANCQTIRTTSFDLYSDQLSPPRTTGGKKKKQPVTGRRTDAGV